jgi:hypothetical protein
MNLEELKPLLDRFTLLCTLYESIAQLSGEHDPETIILQNLNEQFRSALDTLNDRGLLS